MGVGVGVGLGEGLGVGVGVGTGTGSVTTAVSGDHFESFSVSNAASTRTASRKPLSAAATV